MRQIENVIVYPRVNAESSKNSLIAQVMKRPYWCISRQRAWGVPIPVFYEKHTGKVIVTKYDNYFSLNLIASLICTFSANFLYILFVLMNDYRKLIYHFCDRLIKEGNIDFWWSSERIEDLIPANILDEIKFSPCDIAKGLDIFDIWFDSGCTWTQVLQNDTEKADLYLEGYDQFTGWFQSSLLTSVAARNCAPYK